MPDFGLRDYGDGVHSIDAVAPRSAKQTMTKSASGGGSRLASLNKEFLINRIHGMVSRQAAACRRPEPPANECPPSLSLAHPSAALDAAERLDGAGESAAASSAALDEA